MIKTSGGTLARNVLLNLITQAGVSILAFLSIPPIVRLMGQEEFGVLSLIWLVVGYFSVLDLGVGQASVKFLAEQLARGDTESANRSVWASAIIGCGVGTVLSIALWLATPVALNAMLGSGSNLRSVTEHAFTLIVVAIPFVMLQGVFRAVPMALQRFDLVNAVQGASGLAQWGGALGLVSAGFGLYEVTMLTLAIRVGGAIASWMIASRLLPELSFRRARHLLEPAKEMLRFGGWLTIANLASPVVRYLDRVFVAAYHSMRMFTFYVVPYEAMLRLQVIPMSLSSALFSTIAERGAHDASGRDSLRGLYARAVNWMCLVMFPIGLVLVVFSDRLLDVWMGVAFRMESDTVFKLLAISMVLVAISYVPITLLQALGRPDIVSKLYLAEIPVYVGLCFALIPEYGINGAATVWLIRMVGSTAVLLWASQRILHGGLMPYLGRRLTRLAMLNAAFLVALIGTSVIDGLALPIPIVVGLVCGYVVAAWQFCLDEGDRWMVLQVMTTRKANVGE